MTDVPSFKDLFYNRRSFLASLLGFNILGLFLGAVGFGEPILTYISLLSTVPFVLFFLQLANFSLMKKKDELPAKEKFLNYAKRLSIIYTIYGALANLPWTFFWVLYIRTHPGRFPVPQVPLTSQMLFVIAIIPICYSFVGFLIYLSTYVVDPIYDIFKSGSLKEDLRNMPRKLLLQIIGTLYVFFFAIDAPIFYALDVLVGKEYFPHPYLLLNVVAVYLIVFSIAFGRFLMRKDEKRVANIIEKNISQSSRY